MKKAKVIVFKAPNQIGCGELAFKSLAPDEILVETAYSVGGRVAEVGIQATSRRVGDWVSGRNPRPLEGRHFQGRRYAAAWLQRQGATNP